METDVEQFRLFSIVHLIRGGSVRLWALVLIFSVAIGIVGAVIASTGLLILYLFPSKNISALTNLATVVVLSGSASLLLSFTLVLVRRSQEAGAGYTTAVNAPRGVPLVDARSGRVIKTADEAPLSRKQLRARVLAARAL